MTEWAVVGVIITLATFFIAICKPLTSLTNAITKLTVSVGMLEKRTSQQEEKACKSHAELWQHNEKQDKEIEANKLKLAKHEIEIKNIKGGGSE